MDIDPNRPDLTFGQKEIAVALFPIAGMVGSVISGYILDNEYMGRKLSILSMSILGVIVCGTLAFTDRFFALLIILIALV
jgi:sugar phosphate permease